MGGSGSGTWWRWSKRETTNQYAEIRMADVRRRTALEPGAVLTVAGLRVALAWTGCNYGGSRPWFLCPGCGGRRGVLYLGRGWLRCRQCLDLAYPTQNECERDRLCTKAQKIRMRLGGSGSLMELFPEKPKGMHWRTYWRLEHEAYAAERRSFVLMANWLDQCRRG
jgi:hypothetical protein